MRSSLLTFEMYNDTRPAALPARSVRACPAAISGYRALAGLLLVLVLPLAASACGDDATDGTTTPSDAVLITDANNYTAVTTLTIPRAEVPPSGDVDVCWPDLLTDIQCQPIPDPAAAIQSLTLLHFANKTDDEIARMLADGQLLGSELVSFHGTNVDGSSTCVKLSDMGSSTGVPLDIATFQPSATDRFVMLWSTGTRLGVGARSMMFVDPVAGATNTQVSAPSACAPGAEILDFRPDIVTPQATQVPAAGPYLVDWSGLTRDSGGFKPNLRAIDSALLAFYANETPATLQDKILQLENIATVIYDRPLDGRSNFTDLTQMVSRTDGVTAFAGFDRAEPGVWMFALRCSTCQNPSPVLLTVVQPL